MARRTTTTAGQPGGNRRTGAQAPASPPTSVAPTGGGIQAWHLLFIGVLASAAAGAVVTRDSGTVHTVGVIVMILTSGLVAAGLVRTFAPLAGADVGEETEMLAGRTRAALEREKMLVLRSIKEVEFDRGMRKISDADYNEIVPRLRARAVGLIRQLEGGGAYRGLIERDLAALLSQSGAASARAASSSPPEVIIQPAPAPEPAPAGISCRGCSAINDKDASFCKVCGIRLTREPGTCQACSTVNDKDARFCKSCGTKLAGDV